MRGKLGTIAVAVLVAGTVPVGMASPAGAKADVDHMSVVVALDAVYTGPLQALPFPETFHYVEWRGPGVQVLGAGSNLVTCSGSGGSLGTLALEHSSGMSLTCSAPASTLSCGFIYERVGSAMLVQGSCTRSSAGGTSRFLAFGEFAWAPVDVPTAVGFAKVGGPLQLAKI